MKRAWVIGLLALTITGCVSPAWDDHDYALKAGATAQAAASSVELVRLAVRDESKLTTPYLKTLLTEAAESLGSVNGQFGGVQPPTDAADAVRKQVTDLTTAAEDQVRELLTQVRRDGIERPAQAAAKLGRLGAQLRAFEEAHK